MKAEQRLCILCREHILADGEIGNIGAVKNRKTTGSLEIMRNGSSAGILRNKIFQNCFFLGDFFSGGVDKNFNPLPKTSVAEFQNGV